MRELSEIITESQKIQYLRGGIGMANPIENKIGAVFISVSNIEQARDWYCDLLGLPA